MYFLVHETLDPQVFSERNPENVHFNSCISWNSDKTYGDPCMSLFQEPWVLKYFGSDFQEKQFLKVVFSISFKKLLESKYFLSQEPWVFK